MGVSFLYGHRTSTGSKRSLPPPDPTYGACAFCGEKRNIVQLPIGPIWRPLNGTWWHVHEGGASCSPTCRVLLGVHPGPYDELEP